MKRAGGPVQQVVSAEQFRQMIGLPIQSNGRAPHVPGKMNKAEANYAAELDVRLRAGEIRWWGFERIKLKLAPKTYYMPDFAVVGNDGVLEFHEVKGHWEDDAAVKFKVAMEHLPFKFVVIR